MDAPRGDGSGQHTAAVKWVRSPLNVSGHCAALLLEVNRFHFDTCLPLLQLDVNFDLTYFQLRPNRSSDAGVTDAEAIQRLRVSGQWWLCVSNIKDMTVCRSQIRISIM